MNWSGARLVAASIWATVTAGCIDTEPSPPRLFDVGDPCRTTLRYCVDETSVQRCEDDVWTVADCDIVCAELGPAYVADACVDDDCECVLVDPSGCVPDQTMCADDVLSVCSDTQTWEALSCDEVCGQSEMLSLGCEQTEVSAACRCTAEGTACDAEAPSVCVDTSTLATCEAGVWVFEDCGLACEPSRGSGQCVAWATPSYCQCS